MKGVFFMVDEIFGSSIITIEYLKLKDKGAFQYARHNPFYLVYFIQYPGLDL